MADANQLKLIANRPQEDLEKILSAVSSIAYRSLQLLEPWTLARSDDSTATQALKDVKLECGRFCTTARSIITATETGNAIISHCKELGQLLGGGKAGVGAMQHFLDIRSLVQTARDGFTGSRGTLQMVLSSLNQIAARTAAVDKATPFLELPRQLSISQGVHDLRAIITAADDRQYTSHLHAAAKSLLFEVVRSLNRLVTEIESAAKWCTDTDVALGKLEDQARRYSFGKKSNIDPQAVQREWGPTYDAYLRFLPQVTELSNGIAALQSRLEGPSVNVVSYQALAFAAASAPARSLPTPPVQLLQQNATMVSSFTPQRSGTPGNQTSSSAYASLSSEESRPWFPAETGHQSFPLATEPATAGASSGTSYYTPHNSNSSYADPYPHSPKTPMANYNQDVLFEEVNYYETGAGSGRGKESSFDYSSRTGGDDDFVGRTSFANVPDTVDIDFQEAPGDTSDLDEPPEPPINIITVPKTYVAPLRLKSSRPNSPQSPPTSPGLGLLTEGGFNLNNIQSPVPSRISTASSESTRTMSVSPTVVSSPPSKHHVDIFVEDIATIGETTLSIFGDEKLRARLDGLLLSGHASLSLFAVWDTAKTGSAILIAIINRVKTIAVHYYTALNRSIEAANNGQALCGECEKLCETIRMRQDMVEEQTWTLRFKVAKLIEDAVRTLELFKLVRVGLIKTLGLLSNAIEKSKQHDLNALKFASTEFMLQGQNIDVSDISQNIIPKPRNDDEARSHLFISAEILLELSDHAFGFVGWWTDVQSKLEHLKHKAHTTTSVKIANLSLKASRENWVLLQKMYLQYRQVMKELGGYHPQLIVSMNVAASPQKRSPTGALQTAVEPCFDLELMAEAVSKCLKSVHQCSISFPYDGPLQQVTKEVQTQCLSFRKAVQFCVQVVESGLRFCSDCQDLCSHLVDDSIPAEDIKHQVASMRNDCRNAHGSVEEMVARFSDVLEKMGQILMSINASLQEKQADEFGMQKARDVQRKATTKRRFFGVVKALPPPESMIPTPFNSPVTPSPGSPGDDKLYEMIQQSLQLSMDDIKVLADFVPKVSEWWSGMGTMLGKVEGAVDQLREDKIARLQLKQLQGRWRDLKDQHQRFKSTVGVQVPV